jgi:predicted phage-related endonuclease
MNLPDFQSSYQVDTDFPVQVIECRTREEWIAARRQRLQASDTAAILGVGYKNQSPLTVWESKVLGSDDPTTEAKHLRIGKLIEPGLRAIFADETGLECLPIGEFTIYCHPFLDWLGATLDSKTVHESFGLCPVELKNVHFINWHEWKGEGPPPLKFAVQVQYQLAVTGASHGFLFGLIGGNEPIVRLVARDEPFIDAMIVELRKFWGYVERKEMPPVDGSEASSEVLKRVYGRGDGETTMLPHDAAEWATTRETCSSLIKVLGEIKTTAENNLKSKIGSFSYGDLPSRADYKAAAERVSERMLSEVKRIGAVRPPVAYSWKQSGQDGPRTFRACK